MSQALRKIRMAGGRSRAEMVTETACDMRGRAWGRPRDRPQEGEGKRRKVEMTTGLQDPEEKEAP